MTPCNGAIVVVKMPSSDDKQSVEDATKDRYLFPKSILAFIPASSAWGDYGWSAAIVTFIMIYLLLVAIAWTYVLRNWPFRRLVLVRTIIVIAACILISLSAMKVCRGASCQWYFWS